ncbi:MULTISPECIES: F0F1 ATP synthase subunit delta [Psychrobacter]|uniref:F0F1 ATP synthase subunit delta n=1 Tax=Psychrobacter TaxID=497 RepID=UPI0009468FBE|nr:MULTISPECIES: F0F1 ATP synthase subunit delta [unclassified Psychrobacter]OLF40462.1 F0F1 ATP synthase subunit delta [Psychrobacter sp. Rd 27.2]PJX20890.1 F0F1 ATP synthase subunit delta [Psychrobacter sp. L7]
MADLSTLARPYAKAAFDYANENGVVNEWENFLFIASRVVNDKSFSTWLDNPAVSAEHKSAALVDLYDTQVAGSNDSAFKQLLDENQGAQPSADTSYPKVSVALSNFVKQLSEQERLALLPEVYEHYRRHKAISLKQLDAYVTSAYPLTDAQRETIQTRLAASLNASVVIHESVDPSLLAGATIKVGDKIIDDSMRGKLQQLKTQLTA